MHMYVYIYICVYLCIYIYVCMYIYIYMCIYATEGFTELAVHAEIYKYSKPSLGPVSEFVRDLSKNVPFLYGMASLVLALGLGVGAAVLRKILSKLKDKYIPKPTISTK